MALGAEGEVLVWTGSSFSRGFWCGENKQQQKNTESRTTLDLISLSSLICGSVPLSRSFEDVDDPFSFFFFSSTARPPPKTTKKQVYFYKKKSKIQGLDLGTTKNFFFLSLSADSPDDRILHHLLVSVIDCHYKRKEPTFGVNCWAQRLLGLGYKGSCSLDFHSFLNDRGWGRKGRRRDLQKTTRVCSRPGKDIEFHLFFFMVFTFVITCFSEPSSYHFVPLSLSPPSTSSPF